MQSKSATSCIILYSDGFGKFYTLGEGIWYSHLFVSPRKKNKTNYINTYLIQIKSFVLNTNHEGRLKKSLIDIVDTKCKVLLHYTIHSKHLNYIYEVYLESIILILIAM